MSRPLSCRAPNAAISIDRIPMHQSNASCTFIARRRSEASSKPEIASFRGTVQVSNGATSIWPVPIASTASVNSSWNRNEPRSETSLLTIMLMGIGRAPPLNPT